MKNVNRRHGLLLLMGMVCSGCSHLTDWCTCGVNCQYQPRPPLPYQQYPDCVCHSHVAEFPSPSWQTGMETEFKDAEYDSNQEPENENQKESQQSSHD